jgi:hypothetical protein
MKNSLKDVSKAVIWSFSAFAAVSLLLLIALGFSHPELDRAISDCDCGEAIYEVSTVVVLASLLVWCVGAMAGTYVYAKILRGNVVISASIHTFLALVIGVASGWFWSYPIHLIAAFFVVTIFAMSCFSVFVVTHVQAGANHSLQARRP